MKKKLKTIHKLDVRDLTNKFLPAYDIIGRNTEWNKIRNAFINDPKVQKSLVDMMLVYGEFLTSEYHRNKIIKIL